MPGDLEVLGAPPLLLVRRIEAVTHADAIDRLLRHALELLRRRDADGVVDGGDDIDDMMKLGAYPSPGLAAHTIGPGDHQRVAGTPQVRGHLLGPRERRAHRPGPAGRDVRAGLRPAEAARGVGGLAQAVVAEG